MAECRICVLRQQAFERLVRTPFGQQENAYVHLSEEEVAFWKDFLVKAKLFVIQQVVAEQSVPLYPVPPELVAKYRIAVYKYDRRLKSQLGLLELLIDFQRALFPGDVLQEAAMATANLTAAV